MSSLTAIHPLEKERSSFSFYASPNYPRCIVIRFKIKNADDCKADIEINGFADVYYKESGSEGPKRFSFTEKDIIQNSYFEIKLNNGDLISKVRVFTSLQNTGGIYPILERTITEVFEPSVTVNHQDAMLFELAKNDDFLSFVDYIRGIPPSDFVDFLKTNFHQLKETINNSPNKILLEWAVSDWMIFLVGIGKLPTDLLDLSVENYSESYDLGNKKLGIEYLSEEQEAGDE